MEQEIEAELPSLAEKQGVDCDETKDKNAIIKTLNNSWQILKFIVRKRDTIKRHNHINFMFDKTVA